ncbi:hypothetical protein CerSpe_071050 [Prunus speciosa]
MKPKPGGPLWAFQFWLQAYFPESRGAVTIAHTKPLANAFARAPRKHNAMASCFKFFYDSAERTGLQFRVCLTRPFHYSWRTTSPSVLMARRRMT